MQIRVEISLVCGARHVRKAVRVEKGKRRVGESESQHGGDKLWKRRGPKSESEASHPASQSVSHIVQ